MKKKSDYLAQLKFYLIGLGLTAVLMLFIRVIFNTVFNFPLRDYSSVSVKNDATISCSSILPKSLLPLEKNITLDEETINRDIPISFNIGKIKLTVNQNFIDVRAQRGQKEIAVNQPDYGSVKSIHTVNSGEIIVIGDQSSYRFKVLDDDGFPVVKGYDLLPSLFSKDCGLFDVLFQSCRPVVPRYSRELEAVFISGYTAFYRDSVSLVFGLSETDYRIDSVEMPIYYGDLPGTGYVLMQINERFALFDGKTFADCENPENTLS